MKNYRKNIFGYTHHALLAVLVVGLITLAGIKVLTASHAQIPSESANIDTAVSYTAAPNELETSGASGETALTSCTDRSYSTTLRSNETELTTLKGEIRTAINTYRAANNRGSLNFSSGLNASTRQHTFDMGRKGYNDHNTPGGWTWLQRIKYYYPKCSYSYYTVGENILFNTPDIDAATVVKWWKGDQVHKYNMLNPNWRQIGISAVHFTDAPGVYGGYDVTIVTADFGARHD